MRGRAGSAAGRESPAGLTPQATVDQPAVERITAEPHDTDYGSRDFSARDPEGNRWSFGTYRGEPRKG